MRFQQTNAVVAIFLCKWSVELDNSAHVDDHAVRACDRLRNGNRSSAHQQYHYTASTPGILALHEGLPLVVEETLERRFHRHTAYSRAMQAGLEAMGLQLFVSKDVRLDSVIAVALPPGVDSARGRDHMAIEYFVEISGALGLPIVRSGQ